MIQGIYQMTPRRFRKAIDAGVFGENNVELLGGIPFIMSREPSTQFRIEYDSSSHSKP